MNQDPVHDATRLRLSGRVGRPLLMLIVNLALMVQVSSLCSGASIDRLHAIWGEDPAPRTNRTMVPVPVNEQTRTTPKYVEVLAPTLHKREPVDAEPTRTPVAPGRVSTLGPIPLPVFDNAASAMDSWIVTTGGFDAHLSATNVVQMCHLTNGWRPINMVLEQARAQHQQATLPDGRILVVGGVSGSLDARSPDEALVPLNTAEVIDPMRLAHRTIVMNDSLIGHSVTPLPDGRVVIVGGDWVRVFDPEYSSFTTAIRLHHARSFHAASLWMPSHRVDSETDDGSSLRLLVIGGDGLGSIEEIDIARCTSRLWIHRLPDDVVGASAIAVSSNEVLLIGGQSGNAAEEIEGEIPNDSTAWLLSTSDRIIPVECPFGTGFTRTVGFADARSGRIYILGGELAGDAQLSANTVYGMLTWPSMTAAQLPRLSDDGPWVRRAWVAIGAHRFAAVGGYRFVSAKQALQSDVQAGVHLASDLEMISVTPIAPGD